MEKKKGLALCIQDLKYFFFFILILLRVILCKRLNARNTKLGEDRILLVVHLGKPAETQKSLELDDLRDDLSVRSVCAVEHSPDECERSSPA